ncbi:SacI homology domain-containing protein [Xylariaceae sp. FL0804]|nr:SacI homology domain-containing protein [Xylariaceae sp. FL0804]
MPGLARKLLVCAAVDGLIVQPLASRGQRTPSPVKIQYGDATVSSLPRDQTPDTSKPNSCFEAFGVVGLFTVSRLSYLITITGRQQVAQVRGFPVYVVTDVALTPCTTQAEAETAVAHTATKLRQAASAAAAALVEDNSDTESEADTASVAGRDDVADNDSDRDPETPRQENRGAPETLGEEPSSSVAEDVFKRRGSYGRFTERWFSRKGWMMDQKRNLAMARNERDDEGEGTSSSSAKKPLDRELSKTVKREKVEVPPAPSAGESLIPKLLRMAHIWFGTSRSFFFSYDLDLTRSLASGSAEAADAALHDRAEPIFYWNRNLSRPFRGVSEDALLLPLVQGFVGQRTFVVDKDPPQHDSQKDAVEMSDMTPTESASPPAERASIDLRSTEKKYVITVISRRSVRRAGLRYLRRGVDEDGYAANFVETEQILSSPSWDSKVYSFVQVRGSIPLFFTQSPYSLKPLPVLKHSQEANFRAFKKHFALMGKAYGSLQLVNLVERHGPEAIIGNEYQKNADKLNQEKPDGSQPLQFEWFDFHSACRGMKFENVSLLLDTLGAKIEKAGSTVEENGRVSRKQNSVLRTNCMDCLDRTNVCQSSFGKFMLDLQMKEEGFDMSTQIDQENSWFNNLWADNGDAISRQYASTAAMKGDYTRTRKRDYRGMVNDLGLSLTRFYNGMVNDYFSQAAIDFFLGNVTWLVFDEFEDQMMTKDPGVSMTKMREMAIETSHKIAIEDSNEDFIGGWTLLSPHTSDTIRSFPFEEAVLLLTDAALYLCRFDWSLDKVSSFERVELSHVLGMKIGTYITSTTSSGQANESKNVGMVISYEPGQADIKRTNTRSLSSASGPPSGQPSAPASGVLNQGLLNAISGNSNKPQQRGRGAPKRIALKALYAHNSRTDAMGVNSKKMTELEQINVIASEIERLVVKLDNNHNSGSSQQQVSEGEGGEGGDGEGEQGRDRKSMIERGDIISLAEARKSTGILEQLRHSLKKLVWA